MRQHFMGLSAYVLIGALALLPNVTMEGLASSWQQEKRLPQRIEGKGKEHGYRWLAASELVDQFGFLRKEFLPQEIHHLWDDIEAAFQRPAAADPAPCLPTSTVVHTSPRASQASTLPQVVDSAGVVVSGTVISATPGFRGGTPGTALEIRVADWMLEIDHFPRNDIFYTFYPAGELNIGPATICASAAGWPPPPSVGDEILLFPQAAGLDPEAAFLSITFAGGREAVHADGVSLRAPEWLRQVPAIGGACVRDAGPAAARRRRPTLLLKICAICVICG